jgi:oxaloacetate decarboxylase (Na+ extruding) subunit gamma
MSQLLEAGLNLTVIGMGVVFVLLTLLVYIIRVMSALSRFIEGPQTAAAAAVPPHAGAHAAPAGSVSGDELIGVIGAAVATHRKHRNRKS